MLVQKNWIGKHKKAFIPLPNYKVLDLSKLKAFANNKIIQLKNLNLLLEG